jgi:hypothetical protein
MAALDVCRSAVKADPSGAKMAKDASAYLKFQMRSKRRRYSPSVDVCMNCSTEAAVSCCWAASACSSAAWGSIRSRYRWYHARSAPAHIPKALCSLTCHRSLRNCC